MFLGASVFMMGPGSESRLLMTCFVVFVPRWCWLLVLLVSEIPGLLPPVLSLGVSVQSVESLRVGTVLACLLAALACEVCAWFRPMGCDEGGSCSYHRLKALLGAALGSGCNGLQPSNVSEPIIPH